MDRGSQWLGDEPSPAARASPATFKLFVRWLSVCVGSLSVPHSFPASVAQWLRMHTEPPLSGSRPAYRADSRSFAASALDHVPSSPAATRPGRENSLGTSQQSWETDKERTRTDTNGRGRTGATRCSARVKDKSFGVAGLANACPFTAHHGAATIHDPRSTIVDRGTDLRRAELSAARRNSPRNPKKSRLRQKSLERPYDQSVPFPAKSVKSESQSR